MFKVPAVPPTKTPVKSAPPSTPSFTVYSDDEPVLPTPTPTAATPFQIYEDDSDTQDQPVNPPSAKAAAPLPFNPPPLPMSKYAEASPSTMKMLNFQSDDSDSGGEEELVYKRKEPVLPPKPAEVPVIQVSQPTPAKETFVPQTYEPAPITYNAYHYEVMYTCLKLVLKCCFQELFSLFQTFCSIFHDYNIFVIFCIKLFQYLMCVFLIF